MFVTLSVPVQPVGAPVAFRETVPVKPFTGATVMIEVFEPPTATLTVVGLAVTV